MNTTAELKRKRKEVRADRFKPLSARLSLLLTTFLAVACQFLSIPAYSAETLVTTPAQLTAAIATAAPGDTVTLRDGTWPDSDILFTGNGNAGNPITLRAETLGRVHLTGQSRLRIAGNHLVVDGLIFTNGYRTSGEIISFQDTSAAVAQNSLLINCAIIDYNPPDPATDTKWVALYGTSNRVEYCYFRGKTNAGTTLIVDVDERADAPGYHVIAHNYFGFRPALGVNGGETIRVGTSDVSLNQSRTTVEHNLFEQCNGDAEIVSSKSCQNIFRRNTFYECEGSLTLRHGNGSIVEANYFFGNHKPLTGGVRIIGEDHRVINNYFQDLAGTSSRAPLAIMQGLTNSPLNGYFQVKNATAAFNTFVNCTNSLIIGLVGTLSGTPYQTTLPPTNCSVANNIILQPAGKIVDQRITPENLTWEGNIFFGTTLNIATNAGIAQTNPQLTLAADGLWRPAAASPALSNAQGTYNFVLEDFEGQPRPAAKDIGCDQASAALQVYPPLTAANVGPLWMRTSGTFLTWAKPADIVYGTPLSAVQLNAKANAAGTFVYDPSADTLLSAGLTQTLSVVFTPVDLVNFASATQSVTINVLKAPPLVSWTNPASITYGTALSGRELNASANIPGVFTYQPALGTILNAGNGQTLTLSFTPDDTSNFSTASRTVMMNVGKATPAITWVTPLAIEQGTALSAAQFNATANVPGTFTYTPPLGTVLSAGSGQILSLNFTPADTTNFFAVDRSVTLNVTIGGKTLPTITWPQPSPILFGTPLGSLQLNATATAPGSFAYTPAAGTVLPAGNGRLLSVAFTPNDPVMYAPAVKTVSIDVAAATSNAILRVAYLVPANRVSQSHAADTLRKVVRQYQQFFAVQMQANGFGAKTFSFETEPDGVTPLIHVLSVPATDSYLRGDIYGNRVIDVARNAGLTIGAPGQLWWLVPETHLQYPEGPITGGFAVGQPTNTIPVASGWAISGSHELALYRLLYQTNALLYDGAIIPDIGPFPLVQDVSFPWFEGITLSGVSSSALGAGLRNLGEALGLRHDFRNDENFNGNLMGFGFRGIRGLFYPDRYLYNYCSLSYASALALTVSPFFNPNRLATDLTPPNVSISTSGNRTIANGVLSITFTASDDQNLHAALLSWESDSDFIAIDEMVLTGTNASATFHVPYFNQLQTNRYQITVYDAHGNQRSALTTIYPLATVNHAPQPFIRVSPAVLGPGEDLLLDASDSFDPEHLFGLLEVEWDLDGDGQFDTAPSAELTLTTNYFTLGTRHIRARLTAPSGDSAISTPIAVNIRPCLTSLSPVQRSSGYGGGNNKVTVTTSGKCRWTPVANDSWIHIIDGNLPSGQRVAGPEFTCSFEDLSTGATPVGPRVEGPDYTGTIILNYYVEPNPLFAERTGTITIGDQTYTIIQQAQVCTYSISPTNRFHGYATTTPGTIKVTTKDGCDWTAVNTNPWITIISGGSGTGSNQVTYVVAENRVPSSRTGYITIGEKIFTVTQWGTDCALALSPIARVHGENAEQSTVTISTASGCPWTIINTNEWITNLTAQSGNTSSNFTYALSAHVGGAPRVGVVWVNDQSFTVIQQPCAFAIDPVSRAHFYSAQTGSICVAAGPVCAWAIENTNSWISFSSPLQVMGNGRVDYAVEANPTSNPRLGTFSVAGIGFTVFQDGKPCLYDIDPPEYSHEEGSSFAEVMVFADPGCAWSVSSPVSWITILAGEGDGHGSVFYLVDANHGPARSTTLTIAGQDHVVSQLSGIREVPFTDMMIASEQTNSIYVTLDAHGGENTFDFSLGFDANLLQFTSAALQPTAPIGAALTVDSEYNDLGFVGFHVAMPGGYSMPAGTGLVVKVSFRAALVNGKPNTTIEAADFPTPRSLVDAVGNYLTPSFGSSTVKITGFCSLAESLDTPDWNWVTTAQAPWTCQTNSTHDLEDAAASGLTPDNGESYIETTLIGPGILSFWWKVSSEPSNDRLRFYMDGSEQFRISGEVDWEWRTLLLPSGSHLVRWRYNKNGSIASGQDRAWVDQVAYDPAPPSITSQPASQSVDAGATATFNATAVGQPPLTYQWLYNHVPLSNTPQIKGAQTASLTLSNVQLSQAGNYSLLVTTPEGNVTSASALLTVTPILPIPQALDDETRIWTTSGNGTWVGQAAINHDGTDAARSGNITHSQSTSFQTVLTGPGTVTFWWKVSSEPSNDKLTFYVNGSSQGSISGEVDWQKRTFNIGSGSQTLLWTYSKNSSTSVGQDHAWVDEFRFTPTSVAITTNPASQLIDQGADAALTVNVSGTPPISYQWLLNSSNIAGATSATFTIPNIQPEHAGNYSVFVSNAGGSATSSNAVIQVNQLVPLGEALDATNLVWVTNGTPPWVGQTAVSQDGSDAARSGRIGHSGTTLFRTTVTGPGTVSFFWKVSSEAGADRMRFYMGSSTSSLSEQQNISGEVDWAWRSWTVPSGTQVLEWRYTRNSSGVAGQDCGWVDQVHFVPNNTPTPPFIAIQPTNRLVVAPTTLSFNAVAGGSAPLSYQWLFNGVPLTNGLGISGATTTNLTLTNATAAQAGDYSVRVTNAAGSITSAVAHLTVVTAPVITSEPASQDAIAGATINFAVTALGQNPMNYQWLFNGVVLTNGGKVSGATTPTLTLANVQAAQEGAYSVLVSNAAGVALSSQSGTLITWEAARSAPVTNGESTVLQTTVTGPGTIYFSWKVSSETNSDFFQFLINGFEHSRISGGVDWQQQSFPIPAGTQALEWRFAKDATGSAGLDAGFLDSVEFVPDAAPTAPVISSEPVAQSVATGATITFQAGVTGSWPLTYRWRFNGLPLANGGGVIGAGTPRLTLAGAQPVQSGNYFLFVSNAAGVATSAVVSLTVTSAPVVASGSPVISTPPLSQSASENARVNFTVTATGTGPLAYRWQFNGAELSDGNGVSGAGTPTLSLSNFLSSHIGNYSVTVSNPVGSVTSAPASLSVLTLAAAANAPYLTMNQAGYTSWVAQTASAGALTHDGVDAVRSGLIPDNQNTRLETWVDGPGTVTFWWKVSSESVNDNLRFYIGAAEMVRISGEVDWEQQTFAVPAGAGQLLKWRYSKDASGAAGQDAAWVDQISYVQTSTTVAPALTEQPASQTVAAGSTLTLNALASGSFPISYQWRLGGTNLTDGAGVSGAKTPRLTLAAVQLAQAGNYSLFVSNAAGTAQALATLTVTSVLTAPVISLQPVNQAASDGATVRFTGAASGAEPLSYQWRFGGLPITTNDEVRVSNAAGTSTLEIRNSQFANIGNYTLVVSNLAGTVASADATLTLLPLNEIVGAPYLNFTTSGSAQAGGSALASWLTYVGQTYQTQATNGGARLTVHIPPSITSQPTSQTVNAGNDVTFTASFSGTPPLYIQWRLNGLPLEDTNGVSGASTPNLMLADVQAAHAGTYTVLISNTVGAAISSNAVLTVITPPSITTEPAGQTVAEGTPATFTVTAVGTSPLSYRWRRNGTNLVASATVLGVNTPTLTLNNAQPAQAGLYSVLVSNAAGIVLSVSAPLLVNAAMTMGEAMNAPYLQWNTDLAAPWTVQTNTTHDGEAAAQSATINHSDSTTLETLVTGPGTLRFWWKVSSQTNADTLTFTVNGSEWARISGTEDWQHLTFTLPAGEVLLRWTYAKDPSGTAGLDRAWLDEVDFAPTTGPSVPIVIREPEGQDVDPGADVTLSVEALGTAPLSYQWRFEGQELSDGGNVFGARSPALTILDIQAAQAGAYDVIVRNPYSLDVSEQVFINVIPVISIPTAVDSTNLTWITGGYSPWRGQTNYNYDRIDAVQSGVLPNSQTNWIQTTVNGPGAISFWWKCSSQTNADRLRFTINGTEMANLSGETDWRQRTFTINNPGTILRWSYTKDPSLSSGLDRAWVDQVLYGPSAPIITNTSQELNIVDQGTTVRFNIDAAGTKPFSYQWKWNGLNLVDSDTNAPLRSGTAEAPGFITGAVGNHRLTISNAQPYQSGTYVGEVYNQAGVAISPPFSLQVIPALPIAPALNSNLVWETEGASWWVGTTTTTHDGIMAARNGTLDNARSTLLRTTVTGPGTLRFWWKASTETNADILTFYINGTEQAAISGNHNWQQKTYDLVDGTYRLEWEYNKNALLTNGLDQVFLDEVFWGPVPPVITNQPATQTVDQGSTVTFNVGVKGTPPLAYQWYLNNTPLISFGNVSGADTPTLRITGVQTNQAGTYRVEVYNAIDTAFSSNATLTVLPIVPLAQALDTDNGPAQPAWTTSSPAWVGQTSTAHDGVDSARSPAIGDSTTASMQATITGPGTISFWWKVSSEAAKDYLIFYIGNTEQTRISGEANWAQLSYTLPAGNSTVKWTYSKNGSVAAGQDRGWVDQFVFTPTPPSIVAQPVGTNVDQGTPATFHVVPGGTPPFTYRWYLDGGYLDDTPGFIQGANTATLTLPAADTWQAGNYTVVVGNAAGQVTSSGAALSVNTIVPLAQALDGTDFTWTTSGSPAWVGQTFVSHDAQDAARIQGVPHSGSATMQTTITGPGTISFWWKVSSEPSNDKLTFYTNGTSAGTISGEVDWQLKTINLGPGSQTLKWTYSKNSSTSAGQDRAWVDQVYFGAVAPTILTQPASTGVDEGSSATLTVAVGGTPPFTYQWQWNDQDVFNEPEVSGANSSNLVLTGVQLSRAGDYRVLVTGQAGIALSEPAHLTVYPILPLDEALDTPGLTWTTNGNPPWVGHNAVNHDGTDAARSGAIGHSASTTMRTVLSGPGTVSFWWKVSSQTNSDYLTFYTNSVRATRISGEVNWQFISIDLGSGNQTLEWTYSKNSSTTVGQDRAWVDQVTFGLLAPTIITQPANTTTEAGSNATFTVVAAATPPIYYQWLFNGAPLTDGAGITGSRTATLTIANAQSSHVGNYSVIVSNSVGTATSAEATLALNANVSLAQALDGPGLAYTTGGTGQPWKGQTLVSHDGSDAAQSGAAGDSTYSWVKTTVAGPAPISFWWKVSSEQDHDYLKLMVDGVEQIKISGEVDWQQIIYDVPSGTHEVQWRYSKNSSLADGLDRGWVDQIYFGTNTEPPQITLDPPRILIQPVSQTVDVGDTLNISVATAGTMPMSYRWLCNGTNLLVDGGNIGGATTDTLTLYNVLSSQAGNYSVIISNPAAIITSGTAGIIVLPTVDLSEALDATELFLTTSGEAPWVGHTAVTHDGTDAARAGRIQDLQASTMETMLNGPGILSFWWKVSSETNADVLTFSVNGLPQQTISGEHDWHILSIPLPQGSQHFQWTYLKDAAFSDGADRGWIDQLTFVPTNTPPPTTNAPINVRPVQVAISSNLVSLIWEASPARTYKVFYKDDLSDDDWTLLDGEILVTWKIVDGAIVPDVVIATAQDVLAGPARFYKVLEYTN